MSAVSIYMALYHVSVWVPARLSAVAENRFEVRCRVVPGRWGFGDLLRFLSGVESSDEPEFAPRITQIAHELNAKPVVRREWHPSNLMGRFHGQALQMQDEGRLVTSSWIT